MLLFCTYLRTVDYDFKDRLLILTGFGYWIGTDTFFEWYSPAILMLYLIFPFLYRLIDQNNKQEEYQQKNILGFAALLMLFVGVIISILDSFYLHPYHYWLVARIPIFMLGIFVGANRGTKIPFGVLICIAVVGMLTKMYVIMGMSDLNNLNVLGSSLIAPLLIKELLSLFEMMASFASVLTLPGKCSYELFLIHFAMVRFNIVGVINPYVCLSASFVLSYLFHLTTVP